MNTLITDKSLESFNSMRVGLELELIFDFEEFEKLKKTENEK
jgi:hypothetical protein